MRYHLASTILVIGAVVGHPQPTLAQSPGGEGSDSDVVAAWSDSGAPDSRDGAAQAYSYYYVLGSQLAPRDSDSTFVYSGNGCMYQSAGSNIRFQFPVLLPEGSVVDFVRIYYNVTDPSGVTAWLTRYEAGQTNLDVTSVSSSGTSGFDTQVSDQLGHVFDSSVNYTLNVYLGTSSLATQICGIRIAYVAP